MRKNIYLIGFMGVGKSAIGKRLATKTDGTLMEMDEIIEKEQGMSINDIFAVYGEAHFRNLESELLDRIGKQSGRVVSCGGGAVLRAENVLSMKENGTILYLSATPETIFERVRYSTNRPLLNGNMNVEYITAMMEKRKALYEAAADIMIQTDGKTIEDIVDLIFKKF